MNHLGYLFAAYGAIFAVIFIYVVFMGRRQSRLDADLKELEVLLKSRSQSQPEHKQARLAP